MANNEQNTNSNDVRRYDAGLNEGIRDYHSKDNQWTFGRNCIPNSKTGDVGDIGNEPANFECIKAPYTIIGTIYLFADTWAIFSTDDTNCEIGKFQESTCTYTTVVNDTCLNFKRTNLITGISKQNHDCSWWVYWADDLNPDRALNFDKPQFIKLCTDSAGNTQLGNNPPSSLAYPVGCITCVDTSALDCDAIRLAHLYTPPCISVKKGAGGGNLLNGSYFVTGAYLINGQKVTDYFTPSNVQPLFDHSNVAGSLDIIVSGADTRFDEMQIVVVSVVNQQTQAKILGVYSTRQSQISIDIIDNKLVDVPISLIPLHTPIVDKSEAIYEVGDYAIRVGPTQKFDFNYQPLANQIVAKWQSVEYPGDYYRKGGNQTGYLRDEVYPFFIQWEYDDGDLSSSYHVPGRPAKNYPPLGPLVVDTDPLGSSADSLYTTERVFEVYNTASISNPTINQVLPDGGVLLSEGYMGYWESSEKYPDDKPTVWNANVGAPPYSGTSPSDYDLCGKNIRHHKFPEQRLHPTVQHFTSSSPNFNNGNAVRIMGVKFENIQAPVDNNGNPIPGIVGYRILRGSREGNKTIVAKGIINNMFQYNIPNSNKTGLYPNYPYNDLNSDVFVSTSQTTETNGNVSIPGSPTYHVDGNGLGDMFTFHSPDTQFRQPFLSMKEIKVYGELDGTVEGQFVYPDKHPKHKFITDFAFVTAAIAGIGIAVIAANGNRTTTRLYPRRVGTMDSGIVAGASNGLFSLSDIAGGSPVLAPVVEAAMAGSIAGADGVTLLADSGAQLAATALTGLGTNAYYTALEATYSGAAVLAGTTGYSTEDTQDNGDNIPIPLRVLNATATFTYYWGQGTDATMNLIRAMIRWEQHALQYQSECFYSGWQNSSIGNTRRLIQEELYLDDTLQDFGASFRINNLYRGKAVALQTTAGFSKPQSVDNSRQSLKSATANHILPGAAYTDPTNKLYKFQTNSSCHYAALKNRILNQYGQIGGVQQVPTGCNLSVVGSTFPVVSPTIFGGDTYVTRYTEKNTMFFFYDWLYGQPDGYEFNYAQREMLPYPAYWMNTEQFDVADFIQGLMGAIGSLASGTAPNFNALLPSSFHAFDRDGLSNGGFFGIHAAYIYLFNSGVRDFYVESEVNTDLRDWGDIPEEKFYDPYRNTNLNDLFNSSIIKSGNYFKYDYSLSISKLFPNFISWANVQPINYDPFIYESCYVHYPNRIIYSLPQQHEQIKDFWLVYLPNNYKDFKTHVTCIKPINKSGAIFLFETASPMQIVGVDTLQTGTGVSVTVGDGTLFNLPIQSLLNAEQSFEYGACQNSRSVINTPMGVFWMSQDQGKIFNLQNGVQEISLDVDMKWWFAQYLPYRLTQQFPNFQLKDNPVIGIGCQTIFDNENTLVYFMKRDYQVRQDLPPGTAITYVSGNDFMVNGLLPVKLGDPAYFEDASWTVSFDPKTQEWISWHDWHPELCLPGKNTFLTTQTDANGQGGVWRHNEVCDLYCNYYGKDYPFEVEYRVNTATQVNTLRSVEHFVEFYLYDKSNCHDRYLQLLEYFDRGVVYNQEQVSGYLNLVPTPNNNPFALTNYPIINPNSIDILYSKVESKYRWNQFWDVTDDRGQFSAAKRMIWNTAANGYVKVLNPANINYQKSEFQRKAIRGYTHSVWLQKKVCGASKILAILTVDKQLYSPR